MFFAYLAVTCGEGRGKMMINSRLTAFVNGSPCLDSFSAEEVKTPTVITFHDDDV